MLTDLLHYINSSRLENTKARRQMSQMSVPVAYYNVKITKVCCDLAIGYCWLIHQIYQTHFRGR